MPYELKFHEVLAFVGLKSEINNPEEITMEIGDLLFATVNLSRFFEINPEMALKKSTEKFIKRFNLIEERLNQDGTEFEDTSLEFMQNLWDEIKKNEQ